MSWILSGLAPVYSMATLRFDASVGNRGPSDVPTVPADCGKFPSSLPWACPTVRNSCRHYRGLTVCVRNSRHRYHGCLAMGNSCHHRHSCLSNCLRLNPLAAYLRQTASCLLEIPTLIIWPWLFDQCLQPCRQTACGIWILEIPFLWLFVCKWITLTVILLLWTGCCTFCIV